MKKHMRFLVLFSSIFLIYCILFLPTVHTARASSKIASFKAYPPVHAYGISSTTPQGLRPDQIKTAYGLPSTGGTGTIAIIAAYDDSSIQKDLSVFSKQYNLPDCTVANGCFEKFVIDPNTTKNTGWSLEKSLDVEWAHAIAPQAKILLIEAKTASGPNLLAAIDYAKKRKDVVAISMSWGGREFSGETELDTHFQSISNAPFFASSGDSGAGVSWPAVSKNVISVGGTSLKLLKTGSNAGQISSETAWSGSGGGVSSFESEPPYQSAYSIPKAHGMRAVPDVSYNADPLSGFSVYYSNGTKHGWYVLGGTSAGAPQWAAIASLKQSVSLPKLYADKSSTSNASYFRDIKSGSNGTCTYYCDARARYDYVTGLGSPVTASF